MPTYSEKEAQRLALEARIKGGRQCATCDGIVFVAYIQEVFKLRCRCWPETPAGIPELTSQEFQARRDQ